MLKHWIAPVAALWVTCTCALAKDLPPGGEPMIASDPLAAMVLSTQRDAKATSAVQPVDAAPTGRALVVTVPAKAAEPYHVQLKIPTTQPVKTGDTLHLRLTWRADPSTDSEHEAAIRTVFQQSAPPWEGSHHARQIARADWQTIDVPFAAKHDLAAGKGEFAIHLGEQAQVIQIGAVQLLNYRDRLKPADLPRTRATYGGVSADAPWRRAANERIEKHRKADLTIRVVDAAGAPVQGATVHARLTRHAFRFGTMLSVESFHGSTASATPGNNNPRPPSADDVRQMREQTLKYFNEVVPGASLAIGGWSSPDHRAKTLQLMEWAKANDLTVRGHFLMQPDMPTRSWLRGGKKYADNPRAMLPVIEAYFDDVLPALAGKIVNWDAINHAGRWADEPIGKEDQVALLRRARKLDPAAKLYVNENFILAGGDALDDRQRLYKEKIEYFRSVDAPFDGIGFMSHFDQRLTSIPRVLATLDDYAAYGKPLQVTEFDIKHPDDKLAGEYTRDFLTALFSHPAVEGFVMWGIWDGDHWKQSAPLFNLDWSLKPSGRAYIDLVTRQWHTDAHGPTDPDGRFTTRGFAGKYQITITRGDQSTTHPAVLTRDGTTLVITLP